jgi:hypothetical protein
VAGAAAECAFRPRASRAVDPLTEVSLSALEVALGALPVRGLNPNKQEPDERLYPLCGPAMAQQNIMKAIVQDKYGSSHVLQLNDIDKLSSRTMTCCYACAQ